MLRLLFLSLNFLFISNSLHQLFIMNGNLSSDLAIFRYPIIQRIVFCGTLFKVLLLLLYWSLLFELLFFFQFFFCIFLSVLFHLFS